jgi:hypothetical protein
VDNLFAGLLVDARNGGGPVHVSARSTNKYHYLVPFAAYSGQVPWIGFRYDRFEAAMLQAMREITPESLAPPTPEAEVVADLEARLRDLVAKERREELRVEQASDEAEEEAAHRMLVKLVRRRKQLEIELEAARASGVLAAGRADAAAAQPARPAADHARRGRAQSSQSDQGPDRQRGRKDTGVYAAARAA